MRNVFLILVVFLLHANALYAAVTPLDYKQYTQDNTALIHVLTVDPKKVIIKPARAQDIPGGTGTVADIAKHFSALAAINGGFFRINEPESNNMLPAGILKINKIWHGIAYQTRGAIGWDPNKNIVLFDILQTNSSVVLNKKPMPINAVNKVVTNNHAALFTDSYIDSIKLQNKIAVAILGRYVIGMYSAQAMHVPPQAYLYVVDGSLRDKLQTLRLGDPADVDITLHAMLDAKNSRLWPKMPYIVGGGPLLILHGQKLTEFTHEKLSNNFLNERHARTAIGVLPDKRWVFVVAESRLLRQLGPGIDGLSIAELQDFMHSLGCVAALNLDGGGSAVMYRQAAPNSLAAERSVADVILILPRS